MKEQEKSLVSITIENGIATITMNDGKNNLISPAMLKQLNRALTQAQKANAIVILRGSGDVFSAGFDLKILRTGVINTFNMLIGGFKLSRRLLAFPMPVIVACNGHALAMGAFILLSGDYRIGVEGEFKIAANEVEIGLTMPYSAIEICRQRLTPANFDRSVLLSELHNPQTAVTAGFLDRVVEKSALDEEALMHAQKVLSLDLTAHKESKKRMRRETLKAIDQAIRADQISFIWQGMKRILSKS